MALQLRAGEKKEELAKKNVKDYQEVGEMLNNVSS